MCQCVCGGVCVCVCVSTLKAVVPLDTFGLNIFRGENGFPDGADSSVTDVMRPMSCDQCHVIQVQLCTVCAYQSASSVCACVA